MSKTRRADRTLKDLRQLRLEKQTLGKILNDLANDYRTDLLIEAAEYDHIVDRKYVEKELKNYMLRLKR